MSPLVSARPERPIRLHRLAPSGHCHRVELDEYPALRAWLARIEAVPRFVPMPRSP